MDFRLVIVGGSFVTAKTDCCCYLSASSILSKLINVKLFYRQVCVFDDLLRDVWWSHRCVVSPQHKAQPSLVPFSQYLSCFALSYFYFYLAEDPGFSTFETSFISLFVLITTVRRTFETICV